MNPHEWLSDVLKRIPTHPYKQIDELLPHLWHNSKG
ncbi:MAG: transposase domain-containing protein [Rhodothermales bacterium]